MTPRAAALASLVLAAAACGDKKQPPPPAPPPPPPAAPTSTAPDDAACKLLSKDDATRLLGQPAPAGTPLPSPGAAECEYKIDGAHKVSVLIYADGQGAMAADLKADFFGKEPVQMVGVGTRAYRNPDGSSFGVLVKGKFVHVLVIGATPGAEVEKLAQLLVNRS